NRYVSGANLNTDSTTSNIDSSEHHTAEDYRVPSASGGYERWASHADTNAGSMEPLATGSSVINVGTNERIASAVGGAALLAYGLAKPSLPRLMVAALGGALLYRGASGFCSVNAAMGRNT